jgi:hypothetical protein
MTKNEIDNIIFELDEARADTRLTEDEHKYAVAAILAAFAKK